MFSLALYLNRTILQELYRIMMLDKQKCDMQTGKAEAYNQKT